MLKQPNFFYSHPSTLENNSPTKVFAFYDFWFKFMISSVVPTHQAIPGNDQIASPTNQKTAGSKLKRTS